MALPRIFTDSSRLLDADWASLLLRLALGSYMLVNHGLPKWRTFDEKSQEFYSFLGLGSEASLVLAIFAEVICAVLVIIGLGTRWAVIPLAVTMLVAIFGVHFADPVTKWELPLIYLTGFAALFLLGSGRFSVDNALRGRR